MERPTPRVNSALLSEYQSRTVRLIGKVISTDGENAVLEASDRGQVTVKLNRDSNISDPFVEVIGRVDGTSHLIELATTNLGDKIDMDLAEKIVGLWQSNSDIFPLEG